jgi:hypothetical protein
MMMKRMSMLAIAGALFLATAARASAQLPPASDEQRAAGERVVTVDFGTEEMVVRRGESTGLMPRLLDSDGNVVEGATAIAVVRAGVSPGFAMIGDAELSYIGNAPGSGRLAVIVMVPMGAGSYRGNDGAKQIASLPVRVLDFPAESIQIDEPGKASYVGTSLRMVGRVMTTEGSEHATAAITWTTSDGSVALVTAGGIVTAINPGAVTVTAATENDVSAQYALQVVPNPVRSVTISPSATTTRRGDVVEFEIAALDGGGQPISDAAVDYSVSGIGSEGAFVFDDGTFVSEGAGAFRVIASVGGVAAAAVVEVTDRETPEPVELIAHAPRTEVTTSDLWVFEGVDGRDYAYTGTHAGGGGERMYAWDVTDPANIVLMDSVVVDARVVNDVKVSDDATWAIITREGASNRKNGIVVLSLEDPAHPTVISELTNDMTSGIHNVWIMGDVVYAINDGTSAMNILDLSDPSNPKHAGRWELRPGDTNKSLHDVWAEGGYAYLSYWDDGLVILDVGAGSHGGTPTEPQFVSSIKYPAGNTHVAWRDRDYVFLGDEIGTSDGMRGYIHVIDVADIDNPVEVAKYEVPEAGAHNVWVEDQVLYIAYYQGGLRMVDVSGTLRGDLYRQGRELGFYRTNAAEGEGFMVNNAQAWGPQPFKGNVFVSDMNSGLWVVKHARPRKVTF